MSKPIEHKGDVTLDPDGKGWSADCSCGWTEGGRTEDDAWELLDNHHLEAGEL